jgi:hypothetical protein
LLILSLQNVPWSEERDKAVWDLDVEDEFTGNAIRKYIDEIILPDGLRPTRWNRFVPRKVNILPWRLICDRLPTRVNLSNKGIDIPCILCPLCSNQVEKGDHLFWDCDVVRWTWNSIARWLDVKFPTSKSSIDLVSWVDALRMSNSKKKMVEAIVWSTW